MDNSRSSPHSSGNGVLGDVTNLSVGEIRRNRERERYAALSDEQKKARLAKNRQYKQQHKHQPTTSLPVAAPTPGIEHSTSSAVCTPASVITATVSTLDIINNCMGTSSTDELVSATVSTPCNTPATPPTTDTG
uniref:Uncharacterized protein n=1 Tax=Leersia perrieri TaxID=77586 RepID=A0A0D9WEV1_9ORYZ